MDDAAPGARRRGALPLSSRPLCHLVRSTPRSSRRRATTRASPALRTRTAPTRRTGAPMPPGAASAACSSPRPTRSSSASTSTALASERQPGGRGALNVRSIERRLAGLGWHFRQRGTPIDRHDPHIVEVLAGIRRQHGRPPARRSRCCPATSSPWSTTLALDLRGLRDRAMLLLGFCRRPAPLRDRRPRSRARSDPGGRRLDRDPADRGPRVRARQDRLARASRSAAARPRTARSRRSRPGSSSRGSRTARCSGACRGTANASLAADRLTDKHVARLVQRTALAAGVRGRPARGRPPAEFAGHSLRAGLATSAEVDERHVQKQLGHATAEMTRRYQRRRDRFRVNLTKAAGL